MVIIDQKVSCPSCGETSNIWKWGKSSQEKQRYSCQNDACYRETFILDYTYQGCQEWVKRQIVEMTLNGSGVRDIARVLSIDPKTVINTLKSYLPQIKNVNEAFLNGQNGNEIDVSLEIVSDLEAEQDEMWSYVGSKKNQRWLWHAIDHATGTILAYILGSHKDEIYLKLKGLLEPFGITHIYTDGWGAYQRHLDPLHHTIGKANTQRIERKHLTLRTRIKRLARKTICFSKRNLMHDLVSGLFINHHEFGFQF